MSGSATWRRRLLPPLFILIVGGVLAIWASQREAGRLEAVEQLAADLCRSAAAGADLTGRVPTSNPLLSGALIPVLHSVCEPLRDDPEPLEVIASSGDAPNFSDGLATHHAIIRIAGAERLTLRFVFDEGDPLIVGYALPAATGPPAP
ncbi:MAG: hypothetical protein SYC29_15455 [Planctomycetota bacterium]|nr:hypothetical protein [Planctomycetota bacterium]